MNKPESIQKFEMDMKEALSLGCGNKTNTMTKTFNDFLDDVCIKKYNREYRSAVHHFPMSVVYEWYTQAAELYAAYRVEEAGKWVSVDERLPEEDEWVLFWWGNPVPIIGCYKTKGVFLTLDGKEFWQIKEDGITHWTNLPNPPKQ